MMEYFSVSLGNFERNTNMALMRQLIDTSKNCYGMEFLGTIRVTEFAYPN